MLKLLEYSPEDEIQKWKVAFGPFKIKLNFQNIYWEFRSLGHSDLVQRFSEDADFSWYEK